MVMLILVLTVTAGDARKKKKKATKKPTKRPTKKPTSASIPSTICTGEACSVGLNQL
jgi:hypothetical protein